MYNLLISVSVLIQFRRLPPIFIAESGWKRFHRSPLSRLFWNIWSVSSPVCRCRGVRHFLIRGRASDVRQGDSGWNGVTIPDGSWTGMGDNSKTPPPCFYCVSAVFIIMLLFHFTQPLYEYLLWLLTWVKLSSFVYQLANLDFLGSTTERRSYKIHHRRYVRKNQRRVQFSSGAISHVSFFFGVLCDKKFFHCFFF